MGGISSQVLPLQFGGGQSQDFNFSSFELPTDVYRYAESLSRLSGESERVEVSLDVPRLF